MSVLVTALSTSPCAADAENARPEVVVLGTAEEPIRPARVDLVSIELARTAEVKPGWKLESTSLAARIDEASREIVRRKIDWVTWVELGPRSPEGVATMVIVVVGRRGAQAEVEVRRLETREADDFDRAVALKVADMLETILRRDSTPDTAPSTKAPPARAPAPEPADADDAHAGALLEVGVRGATPAGTAGPQFLGALAVGGGVEWKRFALELVANVRSGSGFGAETERGTVSTREIAVGGEGRVLWKSEPLRLGAFAEVGARLVEGEGVTRDGTDTTAWRSIPVLAAGAEARVDATEWFGVRLALGVEGMLRRQRFAIDDVPLVDVGDVRGFAHLAACFRLR
jgi:hypothetical protein